MAKGLPDYRYMSYPAIVPEGGLGVGTLALNGVLLGNVTSPVKVAAAGAADQALRIPAAGGEPAFGAVDLSKAAAVTGLLPVANGGTGTATPALVAGQDINISGSWPAQSIAAVINMTNATNILAKANGGTGEAAPSLVAGANITITGSWPDQTIAASGGAPSSAAFVNAETDFTQGGAPANFAYLSPPWFGSNVASGTLSKVTGATNHPGVIRFTSSANANSGFEFGTSVADFLLAGTEISELVFQVITTTNTLVKFGFLDVLDQTAEVDGVWIHIAATTLAGRTSNNSTSSTTGTSYTIVASTWYRLKIVVNANATRVDFYLYNAAGTQLWTDYLTTNIPTAAGRETGHGVVATNSGTTAVALVDLDYMNLVITRTLTR